MLHKILCIFTVLMLKLRNPTIHHRHPPSNYIEVSSWLSRHSSPRHRSYSLLVKAQQLTVVTISHSSDCSRVITKCCAGLQTLHCSTQLHMHDSTVSSTRCVIMLYLHTVTPGPLPLSLWLQLQPSVLSTNTSESSSPQQLSHTYQSYHSSS